MRRFKADPLPKAPPNKKIRKSGLEKGKSKELDEEATEQVFKLEDTVQEEPKKIQARKEKPAKNFLKKNKMNIANYQQDYKKQHQSIVIPAKTRRTRKYDHIQSKIGMNKMYSSFQQWDSQTKVSQSYVLRLVDTSQLSQISLVPSNQDINHFQVSSSDELGKPHKIVKVRSDPQKMDELSIVEQVIDRVRSKAINVITSAELDLQDRFLGEGGFGQVRQGRWGHIEVAVKQVKVDWKDWNKIESELVFLSTYRHPRMISLYGVQLQPREYTGLQCSLVMELMDNDLDHLIWHQDPLPLKEKVKVLLQMAEGLCFLHGKNLVHRDVKPKNILVKRDKDGVQVKLSDLGLSKLADQTADNNTLSFTPRYTSKEQAEGQVLTSGDMWSAGLICYELLTRRRPWEGMSQVQIITSLVKGVPPAPPGWQHCLEEQQDPLQHLVEKCLDYEPEGRPTAPQFWECLSSIVAVL